MVSHMPFLVGLTLPCTPDEYDMNLAESNSNLVDDTEFKSVIQTSPENKDLVSLRESMGTATQANHGLVNELARKSKAYSHRAHEKVSKAARFTLVASERDRKAKEQLGFKTAQKSPASTAGELTRLAKHVASSIRSQPMLKESHAAESTDDQVGNGADSAFMKGVEHGINSLLKAIIGTGLRVSKEEPSHTNEEFNTELKYKLGIHKISTCLSGPPVPQAECMAAVKSIPGVNTSSTELVVGAWRDRLPGCFVQYGGEWVLPPAFPISVNQC